MTSLFNEATRRHPCFQPLYLDMAKYWAPPSGNGADWTKADEVIKRAAANTAATDGAANYAMLYVLLGDVQRCRCDLFHDARSLWTELRDAFEDLVKRYPSAVNLNEFAVFACSAGDKATFLGIRAQIANRIQPDRWPVNYSPDLCDHRFMQNT